MAESSQWGARRKKFAGYVQAARELKQSYSRSLGETHHEHGDINAGIHGSFPEVKVASNGKEELLLFPSYGKRHIKTEKRPVNTGKDGAPPAGNSGTAEYWAREWRLLEDENAVVDVDVRGWVYSPQRGPLNRKNRLIIGLARQLSGLPAPTNTTDPQDKQEIDAEAKRILASGIEKSDIAERGGYSERSSGYSSASGSRASSPTPGKIGRPLTDTSLRSPSSRGTDPSTTMSPEEISIANINMMARLRPFLTTATVGKHLTIFFYNDEQSESKTVQTDDAGHFNLRAALKFVPTHVRVFSPGENLSAVEEIQIYDSAGIALVSDIDDTIKHSAVTGGTKEIFRNVFLRDLADLTIQGVEQWYHSVYELGVKLHYVSNSPWQLYPLIQTYFLKAELPPGSIHLKRYAGMMQGIFEPVAERKRPTLERIINDFPERKFILVGDSGEADLELYTETALQHPGRILAIFIRDVTTTSQPKFFSRSQTTPERYPSSDSSSDDDGPISGPDLRSVPRPDLPPRAKTQSVQDKEERTADDLMSFSDDEKPLKKPPAADLQRKPVPPARPNKPSALQSVSHPNPTSDEWKSSSLASSRSSTQPATPSTARSTGSSSSRDQATFRASAMDRLSTAYNALPTMGALANSLPSLSTQKNEDSGAPDSESEHRHRPALPPRKGLSAYPAAAAQYASSKISNWREQNGSSTNVTSPTVNKKEEIWKRRWARTEDMLKGTGIVLQTWRVGEDVQARCIGLIKKELEKQKRDSDKAHGAR